MEIGNHVAYQMAPMPIIIIIIIIIKNDSI